MKRIVSRMEQYALDCISYIFFRRSKKLHCFVVKNDMSFEFLKNKIRARKINLDFLIKKYDGFKITSVSARRFCPILLCLNCVVFVKIMSNIKKWSIITPSQLHHFLLKCAKKKEYSLKKYNLHVSKVKRG